MYKKTSYKISISITRNDLNKEKKDIEYYKNDTITKSDKVIFKDNIIEISGNRSNSINYETLLTSRNSTCYRHIVKSLLFVYFKYGTFEIEHIKIFNSKNELVKIYSKNDIDQLLEKRFQYDNIEIDLENLFSNKKHSFLTMNVLMNIIISSNNKKYKFDFIWKAFNALIRELSGKSKEYSMLEWLKTDMQNNHQDYPISLEFANKIDNEHLNKRQINLMIKNNYPKATTEKALNNLKSFFTTFTDHRICDVLKDRLPVIKHSISKEIDKKRYTDIILHLENQKSKNNVDILRLLINKYAYFLRCKYFHAERIPASFIIQNEQSNELDIISEPLLYICIDLVNKLSK